MPKLVRDLIPEIISRQGKNPITRVLDNEEYKKELISKLFEEVQEFQQDPNIEELADIIEVFEATLEAFGFNHQELKIARDKKNGERGKFDQRIFLEEIK